MKRIILLFAILLTLPRLAASQPVTYGTYAGNGAYITQLNADNLGGGTNAPARSHIIAYLRQKYGLN